MGAKNHLVSLSLDNIGQRDRKVTGPGGWRRVEAASRDVPRVWWPSSGSWELLAFPSRLQIYWPAPVEWREECNWAGKDITVSAGWGGQGAG